MLAKRFLTLEEFRQAMLDRWGHNPSSVTASKAIPVPLYRVETMQQYAYKFKQWLAQKGENLAAMRDDPNRERSFWHSFAHHRVGTLSTAKTALERGRKRSMEDEPNVAHNRSKSLERKRARRDDSVERDGGFRSRPPPPPSQRIVAQRVTYSTRRDSDIYGADVLLMPRTQPAARVYVQAFKLWLLEHNTSLSVLRPQPLKERVYRLQYARQKAMKRHTRSAGRIDHPTSRMPSRSLSPSEKGKLPPRTESQKPLAPLGLVRLDRDFEPEASVTRTSRSTLLPPGNPSKNADVKHHASCALSQSDRCGIQSRKDASNRMQPDAAVSPKQNSNPHGGPACSSGYPRYPAKQSRNNKEGDDRDATSHPPSPPSRKSHQAEPEHLPNWASKLIKRMQELEEKVTQLQEEVDRCHSKADGQEPCCRNERRGEFSKSVLATSSATLSPKVVSPASPCCSRKYGVDDNASTSNNSTTQAKDGHIADRTDTTASGYHSMTFAESTDVPPTSNVDIRRKATAKLAGAVQSRVTEDPEKRQLTEAYDHLNEMILMNETAIDGALAYVKAIREVDEASAVEQHSQVMELVVSINQEKERRAAALAALIVYRWAEKQELLTSILEKDPSSEHKNLAKHEKCAAISSQLEEKNGELETLVVELNDQLQSVNAMPSSATATDKSLQFKLLQELSDKLSMEQTAKVLLEEERREVLTCFLEGDAEIRKLVKESFEANTRVKNVQQDAG
ncbi:hypothetical protein PHYPSEUDO_005447 [Phytophthora pseudosyringae]|uniref:Uncharacterized protein n=1 Tax=Phytophthora pseudosyringae TaxID=221518 RepID=A0A8T1VPE5_9STRA|nr:hypothetical protein PHYPSEUDO_005447 [Phytophthora pseudosyringae]